MLPLVLLDCFPRIQILSVFEAQSGVDDRLGAVEKNFERPLTWLPSILQLVSACVYIVECGVSKDRLSALSGDAIPR